MTLWLLSSAHVVAATHPGVGVSVRRACGANQSAPGSGATLPRCLYRRTPLPRFCRARGRASLSVQVVFNALWRQEGCVALCLWVAARPHRVPLTRRACSAAPLLRRSPSPLARPHLLSSLSRPHECPNRFFFCCRSCCAMRVRVGVCVPSLGPLIPLPPYVYNTAASLAVPLPLSQEGSRHVLRVQWQELVRRGQSMQQHRAVSLHRPPRHERHTKGARVCRPHWQRRRAAHAG